MAANIGYHREDNVWVNQYDSLFIIMNGNGQIVNWQFTKDLPQKNDISFVYEDDCCKMRPKIIRIFGTGVKVNFMLVHRITRTLPKRHPLFYQCVSELRTVFRVDGDIGKNRKCNTPPSHVLELKLGAFPQRWESAADSAGTAIFQETKKAVENLFRHIKTGCLSGITPGGGTTKNERIHQHIKNFFHHSKVGIP